MIDFKYPPALQLAPDPSGFGAFFWTQVLAINASSKFTAKRIFLADTDKVSSPSKTAKLKIQLFICIKFNEGGEFTLGEADVHLHDEIPKETASA
ncbi:hypothetical protein P3T73_08655 [Kiritimatiellota bacterium B12222]|nr:hypothetical protein P3T73_08655 [Kiritimatiellota bacterium B12222]